MEITTEAFVNNSDSYFLLGITGMFVGILAAVLVMYGLAKFPKTQNPVLLFVLGFSAFLAVVLSFFTFMDDPAQRMEEAAANIEGQAEFRHGLTALTPMNDPIGLCEVGSGNDAAEYVWTSEEGDNVRGYILKSAEADGECVYELTAEEK